MGIKKVSWLLKKNKVLQNINKKNCIISDAVFKFIATYFFSNTNTILLKSAAALITFLNVSNSLKGYFKSR